METHFPTMETDHTRVARDRVVADVKALIVDAESLLRATADDAGEQVKKMRARLSAALERAKSSCEDLQEWSVESAKLAARKTDETIRAHPYESIAIAVGVGVLLGALIRRR